MDEEQRGIRDGTLDLVGLSVQEKLICVTADRKQTLFLDIIFTASEN